jgi:tRNA pseudouridine38-40 synthase
MRLWRVTLAYDGSRFEGWQTQAPKRRARTVQGVLQEALGRLAGGGAVRVFGAGRTDSGVHALGQVASFELAREIAPAGLQRALNGLLPPDVRVLEAALAPPGFHARRSAVSKLYRYLLDTALIQLPQRRRFVGHIAGPLDPDRVRATAALYVGRRDFRAVASSGGSIRTTVREVLRSEASFEADILIYEVEADGFLRRMVRSLVGGLVAVGQGRVGVLDLRRALEAGERQKWPPPAPACGLTLVHVTYDLIEQGGAASRPLEPPPLGRE